MMQYGKSILALTDNKQIMLPPNFREGMGNTAYLTQGFDRNLFLLSHDSFNTIYSHVKETSISDPLGRLLSRLFLGSAVELAIDIAGNIELPTILCDYAKFGKEIVIVGQGEYSELWSTELWQKQMDSINDIEANSHRFEKFHVSLI